MSHRTTCIGEPRRWPRSRRCVLRLETSLSEDPTDAFLRYGLALRCIQEGDLNEGRSRLEALIADDPEGQIAAYQQMGQSFMENDSPGEARAWFVRGIARAKAKGDWHAASEMEGFLTSMG